jgi:ubiquinone/menaquinone biosynthesis C-methylase UbiE
MSDWSSYDNIAERYDGIWGSRFEEVARHLRERIALPRSSSVLDIGSGTGIVLEALRSKAPDDARLVGCERSAGMIRVARRRVPRGRFVEASALALPFGESTFEVVTASFVLSHLFARHTLGAGEWSRFQDRVRGELRRRFGPVFECSRGVLIGLGRRAARGDAKRPATPATA